MSGKTPRQKWPVVADFRAKGRFCCRRPVKEPRTKDRKFEDVVQSAEKAAVLVLVY
jgi:hypothetical protein